MKNAIPAAILLGVLASAAVCEDTVDNPAYKMWASYKPGAMVRMQLTGTITEDGKSTPTKIGTVLTLKEVTAEKVVVESVIETEKDGQTSTQTVTKEYPAKVSREAASQPATPAGATVTVKGEGDEQILIAGRKFKAHWVEKQITTPDKVESTSKVWTCPDVPGGVLKMVTETASKQVKIKATNEVIEFKGS
jgi:hypothetical protein